jgi:predicted metal-dependent TIM-barrel fold hydrolase
VRLFDAFSHMTWRSSAEYKALARAGVASVVEPCTWHGQPRTHVGTFEDHFAALLSWEPYRAERAGVRHHCALGLNAREANDAALAEGVLWLLPRLLERDGVVAVGALGFEEFSDAEEDAFARQLELARARGLPALVRAPARDARRAVERSLALLRESQLPERLACVAAVGEGSIAQALDSGCWAGLSVHPRDGLDARRAAALARRYGPERLLIGSGADWDESDCLAVPAVAAALADAGLSEAEIGRLLWENPARFYAQSGRLDLSPSADGPREAAAR